MKCSIDPPSRRHRRQRTFTGCLTCRRRKVKCDIPLPCGNCDRLGLDCVSPFTKNLKSGAQPGQSSRESTTLCTMPHKEDAPNQELEPGSVGNAGIFHPAAPVPQHLSASLYNFTGPMTVSREWNLPFQDLQQSADVGDDLASPSFLESICRPNFNIDSLWPEVPIDNLAMVVPYDMQAQCQARPLFNASQLNALGSFPFNQPAQTEFADVGSGSSHSLSLSSWQRSKAEQEVAYSHKDLEIELESANNQEATATGILSPWNLAGSCSREFKVSFEPGIPRSPRSPQAPDETLLLDHFKSHMATKLSVKNSRWNVFSFLSQLSQDATQSLLRMSLLAWAGFHQSSSDQSLPGMSSVCYAAACDNMQDLLDSQSRALIVTSSTVPTAGVSNQTISIISTIYVLCQCDLMAGKYQPFRSRMDSLKRLLSQDWDLIRNSLTWLDYRLLLWLAYMDVRASIWVDTEGISGSETNLLEIISRNEALRSIYLRSRSYLLEAFGGDYPSSELRGDMLQDSTNINFAGVMSVLSRIVLFGERYVKVLEGGIVPENIEAKSELQAIYAALNGLSDEYQLGLKGFLVNGNTEICRSSYHWLNLEANYHCAIILLNRILNPGLLTHPESAESARTVLQIILRLRDANMLHNPHSMLSPFPLFIAGIETQDPVYQDWTLSILTEFQSWGSNISKVKGLLKLAIERQKATKCRVNIGRLMKEYGLVLIA